MKPLSRDHSLEGVDETFGVSLSSIESNLHISSRMEHHDEKQAYRKRSRKKVNMDNEEQPSFSTAYELARSLKT